VAKLCIWLLAAALFVPGLARAQALDDCTSAYNHGANTSAYFVTTVFARTLKGTQSRLSAHTGLDKLLGVYSARARYGSEELSLCYVHGLWETLVARVAIEYAHAGGSGEFACLDRLLLARHAGVLLRGVAGWADLTSLRNDVLVIFAGPGGAEGVPWCEPPLAGACAVILATDATDYMPFVEPVAGQLCDEPPPPPVVDEPPVIGQPDAGSE
jgi:hypothetical protein